MVSFGFFFCVYVGVVLLFYEIKGGGGASCRTRFRGPCGRKTKKKQYACFEKLVKTGKIVRLQIHFNEFFFSLKQYIINGVFPVNIGICCVNKQLDG